MDMTAALASTLAYGRIALGVAMVAAPGPVGGRWIGRAAGSSGPAIAVRGLGIRDVALGAATLGTMKATGTSGTGFKVLTGLGVVVDLVDVASTLAAGEEVPDARMSAAVAGLAAATGVAVLALSGDDA